MATGIGRYRPKAKGKWGRFKAVPVRNRGRARQGQTRRGPT